MTRAPHLAVAALAIVAVALGGCVQADVTPSPASPLDCTAPLPEISRIDEFPDALLRMNAEDLGPVRGDITWLGGEAAAEFAGPPRVHALRFIVTVGGEVDHLSIRMTESLGIAEWEVWVVPTNQFRRGDLESDRETWSSGADPTDIVCLTPGPGDWLVGAELTFDDEAGAGTYYWRIITR